MTARQPDQQLTHFLHKFGQAHLDLAYHAAFPIALTPDLVYRLWAHFRSDGYGHSLNIPWVAVADIILAPFCQEVGFNLYEIDADIRASLLEQLKADPRFGAKRLNELADFLLTYHQASQLQSADLDLRDLAQAQRWTALAQIQSPRLMHDLARSLVSVPGKDGVEWGRMATLLEQLPLADGAGQTLRHYARGMAQLTQGQSEAAIDQFRQLPGGGQHSVKVAGVSLEVPEEMRPFNNRPKTARRRWLQLAALIAVGIVGMIWISQAFAPGNYPAELDRSTAQVYHRRFLYIGVEGDEANRLVLAELGRQERTILTPDNLVILAFEPYPLGDKVLFTATDTSAQASLLDQQLYTVTTGIQPPSGSLPLWRRLWLWLSAPATPGELELLLDDKVYQNLKFDLSPDGQIIVVQRVNRQDPADFGPWVLRRGRARPLLTEPGGDFMIGPDSQTLLLLQGQGVGIIDLGDRTRRPRQPLDFLPNFDFLPNPDRVLDMAADGTAAAMVNFNQDDPEKRFTESLLLVTNQGREEELLQVSGSILEAHFDPTQPVLYVLATELVDSAENSDLNPDLPPAADAYVEQPLLLAVTFDGVVSPLLRLPQQQRIHMSVAPDGRSLLLDLASLSAAEGPKIWHLPLVNQPLDAGDAILESTISEIAELDDLETAEAAADPSAAAANTPATIPAVVEPEVVPFSGIQATWMP